MSTTLAATAPAVPVAASVAAPVVVSHQTLLADLRADCVRERERAMAESAGSAPDPVAVSRASRLLRTIEEIDAALERIANGSYGSCVHCGAVIPAERLEFRPFAAACVACGERAR